MNFGSNNPITFGNNLASNNQQNNGFNGLNTMSPLQPKTTGFSSPITTQNSIFGSTSGKTEPAFGNSNPTQFNNPSMTTNNQSNSFFGNTTNQPTNMFSNTTPVTNQTGMFSNTTPATNQTGMFSNNTTNLFGNSNQNTFGLNQGPTNAKLTATFGTGSNTATTGFAFGSGTPTTTASNNLFGNQQKAPIFNSPISTTNSSTGFNFGLNTTAASNNTNFGFQSAPINTVNTSTQPIFGNMANNSIGFTSQNSANTFATNNSVNAPFSSSTSNPFGVGVQQTTTGTTGLNFGSAQPVTNPLTNITNPVTQTNTPIASTTFPSLQSPFMNTTPASNPISFASNASAPTVAASPVSAASASFTPTVSPFPLNSTTSVPFSLNLTSTTPLMGASAPKSSAMSLFTNINMATSTASPQQVVGLTNSGLGGISTTKLLPNNASPLAVSSVSAKKGLGGSPISDTSKPVLSKDAAQKSGMMKQVKDTELQPELRDTVETFTKFVAEQKKLREEIIKSNDVASVMLRVEEESQALRQSISEVANGLQKIQIQSNKLKSDITKEQSSINIAQTSSDSSMSMSIDRSDSVNYFAGKVRDLENRAGLYLQEIEAVESLCQSPHKSALTTRDLVDIIRKMDDEFIGLAANLYMVHERVKSAKAEVLRRSKQMNNHQNPFAAIEGRFGETFASISGSTTNQRQLNTSRSAAVPKAIGTVGGSPFDSSCYMNQMASFSFPKPTNTTAFQKPSIFGLGSGVGGIGANSNNNNQPLFPSPAMTTASPFSSNNTTSSFALNKTTNLFSDTGSNKKRR